MTVSRWLAGVVSALAGRLRALADRLYPPYPERLRREGYDSGGILRAGVIDLDYLTFTPERDLSPAQIAAYEGMWKRLNGE
jgi:hypothetical protein